MNEDRSAEDRDAANGARWLEGEPRGHYESWFCRANHPRRPLAFWIRYTLFSPEGRPEDAVAELWAIAFDRERSRHVAAREAWPIAAARFDKSGLGVRVLEASLEDGALEGEVHQGGHRLAWSLRYEGDAPPLYLLDPPLYGRAFPKAKALVPAPSRRFSGTFEVDGETIEVEGWPGSQNHNWGSRHTDRYAWGQVAAFDEAPESFLEVATAQVALGPLHTPPMTVLVLRHEGREHHFRTLGRALKNRGRYSFGATFRWSFAARDGATRVVGELSASREDFVGLGYANPPGGTKTCLNSKLARAELLVERPGHPSVRLLSAHGAAFEILTSRRDHGVPVASGAL